MKLLSRTFVLLIGLALSACASAPGTTLPAKEVVINAHDIAYEAVTIEVAVGQPVKLTLNNTGVLEHDFSITDINVADVHEESTAHGHTAANADLHVAAEPGTSATLEFTPTAAGTYEFFCTTAGHKEAGMVGQLIVK